VTIVFDHFHSIKLINKKKDQLWCERQNRFDEKEKKAIREKCSLKPELGKSIRTRSTR